MAKFSNQFEGQLVPEWKEAFVDYWQLKKDLKKIHLLNNTAPKTQTTSLANNLLSSIGEFSLFGRQHRDHGVIQVFFLSLSLLNSQMIFLFCFVFNANQGDMQERN